MAKDISVLFQSRESDEKACYAVGKVKATYNIHTPINKYL